MGAGGAVLLASALDAFDGMEQIESLAAFLIVANLLVILIHLWTRNGAEVAAREYAGYLAGRH